MVTLRIVCRAGHEQAKRHGLRTHYGVISSVFMVCSWSIVAGREGLQTTQSSQWMERWKMRAKLSSNVGLIEQIGLSVHGV
jgi:hypothetical protein